MMLPHVSRTRRVITKPCLGLGYDDERSPSSANDTSSRTISGKHPPTCGTSLPRLWGHRLLSLNSDPHTRRDAIDTPYRVYAYEHRQVTVARDEKSHITHDRTVGLTHGTHHALLRRHQEWTSYMRQWAKRVRRYAIPRLQLCTILWGTT
jgi:hypothetical protein